MNKITLEIKNLSKLYRLGEVGTGTLSHDLNRWWAKVRGKEDPFALVGQVNDRSKVAESDYVWALKDINFSVEQGEVLGIIGRNGAGKSTLLKLISQITSPSTGSIKAKGRIASLLEVGTGMNPELTAKENIYLNGAILGMTKKEIASKFDEIVDFSGCAMYIDTPIKRFSSGMRVRLGFAVAAFLEPEILIVDEVLAVGDAEFQKKAIGKMKDISAGGGRTVLFVSHNMASVKNLCEKVILLENGKVSFYGDVDKGIDYYIKNSSNIQASHKLEDRTDRNGKGNVKLKSIEFINPNIGIVDTTLVGVDLNIQITFNVENPKKLIGIRLLIKDKSGVIRSVLNGAFVYKFPILVNETNKVFSFSIKRFPFPEGSYTIDFACYSQDGEEDNIENVASLNCEAGDYYGTGKLPAVKDGVFINYSFESNV